MKFLRSNWFPILLGLLIVIVIMSKLLTPSSHQQNISTVHVDTSSKKEWIAPSIYSIPVSEEGNLIRYGRDLIVNTSKYLGPKGIVASVSNRMNCQNCHVDAGAKPYGNCFSGVASIYPVFRARSGIVESIEFRINDCLMRSLNGKTIDSTSKEMKAMVAYFNWIGKDVPKGVKPAGAGTEELPYMQRAADPLKGKIVYETKCRSCHGKNGEGLFNADSSGFVYPPLWGPDSYNIGAGLFRLTRFAGYVKNSMPFGASHENPQLTNEEAWDVAAFVNSQPRPKKNFSGDWPDIKKKAIDYPFGPYADSFSESQHKFGPFIPIKNARESKTK
ncbi:MAG: c-type cytochrome [Bacteroidota bacterium]|nr:c-type cytochrome [Bacteroidota bacterium]